MKKKGFKDWFNEDDHDLVDWPRTSMQKAFDEGSRQAAMRCRQIAQQHTFASHIAYRIDEKIQREFEL